MKAAVNYEQSTRFLCASLSPTDNAAALEKQLPRDEEAWVNILALSNHYLLTPALFIALRDKGLLEKVDAKLAGFLGEVYQANLQRNQQLLKQMHTVARLLNQLGIQPVLLKGVGSLAENLFDDPGCRSMLDIDILVAEEQLQPALEMLTSAGYFTTHDYSDVHHLPRMFHDDEPAGLELHHKVLPRSFDGVLTTSSLFEQSMSVSPWGEGAVVQVLSIEHQIMYNFLHSQISHQNFACYVLELRQMHHFAILTFQHRHHINWNAIENEMSVYGDAYQAYLEMINILFALHNPVADHNFNVSQYFDRALQRAGSSMGWLELLKLEWSDFKFIFSPARISRRFGATTPFEVVWYTVKHIVNMINKYIVHGAIFERLRRHQRRRVVDDMDES